MDALPALRFFLSIGVVVRPYAQGLTEWGTGPWPKLIEDMGVWSVRGKVGTVRDQLFKLKSFYVKGGTQCFTVVSQDSGIDKAKTAANIQLLPDHFPGTTDPILMQGRLNISGFESANELNNTLTTADTVAALRDMQPFIKQTIEANAKIAGLPCVGPSIWSREDVVYNALGSLEPDADIWCLHYYNEGRIPTVSGLTSSPNLHEAIADARQVVPNGPGFITEMGNKSAIPDLAGTADKLSGKAQSKYACRCYFDYFFNPNGGGTQNVPRGAEKNFMYNAVDDQTLHWGLMTGSAAMIDRDTGASVPPYTRRPHSYAIQRLLNRFRDFTVNPSGNTIVPVLPRLANYALEDVIAGSLPITFGTTPTAFRSWLFRKADGTFILAMYRDIESWKRTSPIGDVDPAEVGVVVNFGSPKTYRVYHPTYDEVVKQGGSAASPTIMVADHVVLVEIDAAAGAGAVPVYPLSAAQAHVSGRPTVTATGTPSQNVALTSAGQAHNAQAPTVSFTPAPAAAPITPIGAGGGAPNAITGGFNYLFSNLRDAAGAAPTLQTGDLVIVSIAHRTSTAGVANPPVVPGGYAQLVPNQYADGTTHDTNLRSFYKFMGAVPDTFVQIPPSPAAGAGLFLVHVLRNVDPATPLDVASVTVGYGNSSTGLGKDPPPILPVTPGAWIYSACGSASGTVTTLNKPANMDTAFSVGATATNVALSAALTAWGTGTFNPDPFVGGATQLAGSSAASSTVALRPGQATVPIEYKTCWDGSVIPVSESCPPEPPPPSTQAPVQSLHTGHVTADSVMITVKMQPPDQGTASSIRIVASTSANLANPVYSAVSNPTLDEFRLSKITLSSLLPDTQYFYGVEVEGVIDIKRGRFKTLPTGARVSFRFAIGSCTDPIWNKYASYSAMLNLPNRPLFMLNIGDFHYENVFTVNGVGTTEAHHHAALDKVFQIPVRAQFHAEIPTILEWDDHDFGGNNLTGRLADNTVRPGTGPAVTYARRRWPQPQASSGSTAAVYFSFVVGRLRIIVSDMRTAKTDSAATDNASKVMWLAGQNDWFKAELDAAAAAGEAVLWANAQPFRSPIHAADDDWGSYHTHRKELLNYMKTVGLSGKVLIVCGDMHASARWSGDMLAAYTTTGENGMNVTVWHVGPIINDASYKGGPYDAIFPAQGSTAVAQMFNLIDVAENIDGSLSLTHTATDANVDPNVQRLATSNVWTPFAPRAQVTIGNSVQGHSAEAPAAIFRPRPNPLPANSLHAHNAAVSTIAFTPRPAAAPINAAQAHSAGVPSIASAGPVGTVAVSSPLHAHNSSSPLIAFSVVPTVTTQNAAQGHAAAILSLIFNPVPNYSLSGADASHAHNAALASLGYTPPPPVAPVNLVLPTITVPPGGPIVGATVRGSDGGWDTDLTGIAYQWRAGGVVVALGQTAAFIITNAELGKVLTFDVLGSANGFTTTATSLPTVTVTDTPSGPTDPDPTPTPEPTVQEVVIPRLPLTRESKERMKRDLRGRKLTRGQIAQAYRVSLATVFWVELEMYFYG